MWDLGSHGGQGAITEGGDRGWGSITGDGGCNHGGQGQSRRAGNGEREAIMEGGG